ncbi:tape measure domain-containing protein [Parabacteroides sp. PFB2-12]|uniref:tape measure protein n=1 Tax=unclassified Parabacteroides TaxID=2649774 RepID=UPI0024770922|nr:MULTISPECIES: tape measure protein [unclassified Parabacteroides]MDH6342929.1 tape measure domain-containing protein [Parabacteroides sp. PM6-13]MDH6391056.1 tape measure domain-containing protein [Parabacteroides sp. PFB2-12]
MSGLYFRVGADFEALKKLKKEIDDLKTKLSGMDKAADPKAFNKLDKQLQSLEGKFNRLAEEASKAGASINSNFKKALAGIGGTAALTAFAKEVVNVRGEFQQLEIAFGTMLKSGDKAKVLIGDLTDFAARTPFGLQSAAEAAKQLIAYGSQADSVIQEMTMLGDVAAGTGQSIGDIVYLYGTLRMQGRAYLMDIRQFAGRGIPIYKELANVLGVAEGQVNDLVSAGKVGFKEVEQAFKNMTSSGGMYGGLMENQSKAITGQIEALKDNIQVMFNEIGQSSEGVIGKAIESATLMVENYEIIGKTIAELVVVYGSYKALLISISALQSLNTKIMRQAVVEKHLAAAASIQLSNAEAIAAARTKMFTLAQASLSKSLKASAALLVTNPYVVLTAAVVGLGYGIYKLSTYQTEAEKSQKRLAETMKDFNKSTEEESVNIDILFGRLKNAKEGTEAYQKAKDNIINKYGNYLDGLNEEIRTLKDIEGAYKAISEAAIQSAKDRAIEKGTQSAVDNYTEQWGKNIDKIRKSFNKEFGEAQGTLLLDSLKESLSSGSEFSKEVQDAIDKFNKTVYVSQGMFGGASSYQTNPIDLLVVNIRKSKGILDNEISDLESIYGKLSKKEDQKEVAPFVDFDKQLADTKGEIDNLKKNIENLRKGIAPIELKPGEQFDFAKAIEDEVKALQEAEKKLETMTGQDKDAKKSALDTNRLKSETADRLREIEEMSKKLAVEEREAEHELQQQRINLMEEGTDKTLAQINLDYDKRELEIMKRGAALIKQQQELERKTWEAANPDWKDKGMTFTSSVNVIADLPEEKQNLLAGLFQANTADRAKSEKDLLDSVLDKYQDFAKQREKLEEEYNDTVSFLNSQRTEENAEEINRALVVAKKQYEKGLKDINSSEFNELSKASDTFTKLFSNAANMSRKQLKSIIDETKRLIDNPSDLLKGLPFDEIKDIYNALIDKQNELDSRTNYPFSGIVKGLQKLKESAKLSEKAFTEADKAKKKLFEDNAETSRQEGLNYIYDGALEAVQGVSQLSDMIGQLADATGDQSLSDFTSLLKDWGNILEKTISGAKSGGIWGAVAGAVAGIGSSVFNGLIEEEERIRRMQNEQYDWQHRFNLLLSERNYLEEEYSSFFGKRGIEQAIKAYDSYKKTIGDYNDFVNEKLNIKPYGMDSYQGFSLANWSRTYADEVLIDAMKREMTVLQGSLIQTAKHVWYKQGSKDKFTTLFDFAPEIWGGDLNGEFDVEAARLFLETHKEISKELRTQLALAIDQKEAYDEAMKVLDDHIESTFGGIASDLTDIIFDAVRNGSDAWDLFEDSGLKVIDALGKALLQEMILGEYLEQYKPKIRDAFSLGDPKAVQEELLSITSGIFDSLPTVVDSWMSIAKDWDELAKANGWEIDRLKNEASTSDNSLAGALGKANQQSIDLLAGQMGAGRVALERGANAAESIRDILKEGLKVDSEKINAEMNGIMQQIFGGKGFGIDMTAIDSVKDGFQLNRDIMTNSFGELTAIRDLNSKIEQNMIQLNSTSKEIAEANRSIVANTERLSQLEGIAESGKAIAGNTDSAANSLKGSIEVKMKGGGLGL